MTTDGYSQKLEGPGRLRAVQGTALALAMVAMVAMGLAAGCDWEPAQAQGSAEQLYQLCTSCHGMQGEGNPKFNAPAIAGLPQWYIESQLKKFRTGVRGTHFDDLTGMQMRPMAVSLHSDAELKTIAAHVSNLSARRPEPTLEGDASRGQALFTPCTACHGPNAAGNEQLKAPPLQTSDWYLVAQLRKFKHGVRGADPRDIEGGQMAPQALTLADEQAMRDVVAHIMTLK